MAIELHHLHPGHDEVARLKSRIAELERMDTEHTLQIAKMNGYIHHLEEELEASKRKEKESRELADPVKRIVEGKKHPIAGMCSEERSMISPDYSRNFICDFILGKKQDIGQLSLF